MNNNNYIRRIIKKFKKKFGVTYRSVRGYNYLKLLFINNLAEALVIHVILNT